MIFFNDWANFCFSVLRLINKSLIVEKTYRTKLNMVIPLNVIQLLKRITSFTHLLDVGSRMLDVGCWTGDISQEMEVGRRETEVGCLMLED